MWERNGCGVPGTECRGAGKPLTINTTMSEKEQEEMISEFHRMRAIKLQLWNENIAMGARLVAYRFGLFMFALFAAVLAYRLWTRN